MPELIVILSVLNLKKDSRDRARKTVEDTPNGLLDEEADNLVAAEFYRRTAKSA